MENPRNRRVTNWFLVIVLLPCLNPSTFKPTEVICETIVFHFAEQLLCHASYLKVMASDMGFYNPNCPFKFQNALFRFGWVHFPSTL